MESTEIRPGVFLKHHDLDICQNSSCPIHNPTKHAFRKYPLGFNYEFGVMVRIVDGKEVLDPDDYKLRSSLGKAILRNSAICGVCSDEVVSRYRWDFVICSCGNVAVDGGNDYLRRVFGDGDFTDTSIEVGPGGHIGN